MASPDDMVAPPVERPDGVRRPRKAKALRSWRLRVHAAAQAGLLGHWLQSKPQSLTGARSRPKPRGHDGGPVES
ncbi:MAG TPA: hypothetical protein VLX44_20170 [Xanthobacteraceae bacterium]|nr:hypothetical protein [Xanthobacteraceae bacterium]